MSKQRPLIFTLLVLYVVTPGALDWAFASDGHWLRPFGLWLALILVAVIWQYRKHSHDL